MRFPRISFLRAFQTIQTTMLVMKEMKQEKSVNKGEIRKKEERVRTVGKGKEIR